VNDYFKNCTSLVCIFVGAILGDCLGVIGPEYQGGHIPELTGHMWYPSRVLGSVGKYY
jgi:hypothetical protein